MLLHKTVSDSGTSVYCMPLVRLERIHVRCCSEGCHVDDYPIAGLESGGHSYLAIKLLLVALFSGCHIGIGFSHNARTRASSLVR